MTFVRNSLLVFVFLPVLLLGQTPPGAYGAHVGTADSLFRSGRYAEAAGQYSAAFKTFGWKGYSTDRYNAARAWALAGVPDSAFYQLDRLATKAKYASWKSLDTAAAFAKLKTDPRWAPLYQAVRQNSGIDEATYDEKLMLRLDSLSREDQRWRNRLTELRNSGRADTIAEQRVIEGMRQTDSLNHFELARIIRDYGFPHHGLVGVEGTHDFWLLMQHQDRHPAFQEQVLALMEKEVARGKASASDYAYLLDRVRVNTGRPQVYGTQMQKNAAGTSFEPKPVEEPEKLNERRASVGLGTIEEYTEGMNRRYFGALRKQ